MRKTDFGTNFWKKKDGVWRGISSGGKGDEGWGEGREGAGVFSNEMRDQAGARGDQGILISGMRQIQILGFDCIPHS